METLCCSVWTRIWLVSFLPSLLDVTVSWPALETKWSICCKPGDLMVMAKLPITGGWFLCRCNKWVPVLSFVLSRRLWFVWTELCYNTLFPLQAGLLRSSAISVYQFLSVQRFIYYWRQIKCINCHIRMAQNFYRHSWKVFGLNPSWYLCVWSLDVFPVIVWVFSGTRFPPTVQKYVWWVSCDYKLTKRMMGEPVWLSVVLRSTGHMSRVCLLLSTKDSWEEGPADPRYPE